MATTGVSESHLRGSQELDLDLREYVGGSAHAGQRFQIETRSSVIGSGRFIDVRPDRLALLIESLSVPELGSLRNTVVSLELARGGRCIVRSGEWADTQAAYRRDRSWLNVSLPNGLGGTLTLWREHPYTRIGHRALPCSLWITPTDLLQGRPLPLTSASWSPPTSG